MSDIFPAIFIYDVYISQENSKKKKGHDWVQEQRLRFCMEMSETCLCPGIKNIVLYLCLK